MNTNPAIIVRELRVLMPVRRLEAHEARSVAERQATKLLVLLGMSEAPVDLAILTELPRIEVRVDSRLAQLGISGLSESSRGQWRITINRTDAITRRRFTLAHEFKHVLDHPFVRTLYPLSAERENPAAEKLCDYFAACLLMPRPWVKRLYTTGLQDIDELAARFRVSPAAMSLRLQQLGMVEPQRRCPIAPASYDVSRYFRQAAPGATPIPAHALAA
jgi:predicted transcriptional regulator